MFLEKFSRFFRTYDLIINPRHKKAPELPLVGSKNFSVEHALRSAMEKGAAEAKQPNGDIIELMDVSYDTAKKVLVLLFHRASPDAADPTYRRKAKGKVTTRQAKKELGEEQSVSAHLVIQNAQVAAYRYRAALEEIPGISMSTVQGIIGSVLREYEYGFKEKDNGKEKPSYAVFKSEGVKSETLTNALKKGEINMVTLVRPAQIALRDSDGLLVPMNETLKLKVTGEVTTDSWWDYLPGFAKHVRGEGWEEVMVDIEFDDKRRRTVALDRSDEAKEVLFVRSELANFDVSLDPCATEIVPAVVAKALGIIRNSRKPAP